MKTGVYFCNCGGNVSDKIDSVRVEQELAAVEGVSYFKTCPFLCSEEGQEFLAEDLRQEGAQGGAYPGRGRAAGVAGGKKPADRRAAGAL